MARMFTPSPSEVEAVRRLCIEFGVRGLWLFGSAVREDFDAARSDLDLLVDFGATDLGPWARRFFELRDALGHAFDRPVDLVMVGAVRRNPAWANIMASQVPLYAAA
jgi:predicted nucleotidyltransferase